MGEKKKGKKKNNCVSIISTMMDALYTSPATIAPSHIFLHASFVAYFSFK